MKQVAIFSSLIFSSVFIVVGMLVCYSLLLLSSSPAYAARTDHSDYVAHTVRSVAGTPEPAQTQVTILVLDQSSFMLQHDPDNLRCSAASAYTALSGPHTLNNPRDIIGIVGLDNHSDVREKTSPHFQQAMALYSPAAMDMSQERQGLQQIIEQNCLAYGTVPTYDALLKAQDMLTSASKQYGTISGSVILFTGELPTDGATSPDTQKQENAITSKIVPNFKQHDWSIDTIALDVDAATLHFLQYLSNATSGRWYQDNDGNVPRISSLNIMPSISDIFARHHDRIDPANSRPITLTPGSYVTNLPVNALTAELDIIVALEQPQTVVTLASPHGVVYSSLSQSTDPAVNIETDSSTYVIFTVQVEPRVASWRLRVDGQSGQHFLLKTLVRSSLQITIPSPGEHSPLLLGQPFSITATVTNQEGIFQGGLNASATYADDSNTQSPPTQLNETSPGTYQGQLTVPATSPTGSYEITISVTSDTSTVIANGYLTIKLERFPMPFFVTQRGQPTTNTVSYTFDEIDPQWLHGLLFAVSQNWPFSNFLAPTPIRLSCLIKLQLQGKLYRQAKVNVVVTPTGSTAPIRADVINDGKGQVQIIMPSQTPDGSYDVSFRINGTPTDSFSDTRTTTRTIRIVRYFTLNDILVWTLLGLSTLFAIILALLLIFVGQRFISMLMIPRPFGECFEGIETSTKYSLGQARFKHASWFVRHRIKSEWINNIPPGLEFRFRLGQTVEVRSVGEGGQYWKSKESKQLTKRFQKISVLQYQPERQELSSNNRTFLIEIPSEESQ